MNRLAILLIFLLGTWSGATVFMWQTAIQNFAVANGLAVSENTDYMGVVEGLSEVNLRLAVRHQASEVNRLFFRGWGNVQVLLAVVALFLAWKIRLGKAALGILGVMLSAVLFLQLYVLPESIRLGRMLDFVSHESLPEISSQFWTLHHSYTGIDMLRFSLGLYLLFLLLRLKWPASEKMS